MPISIRVPIGAWDDMTEQGLRIIGCNLYFLFSAETSPDPITFVTGIMLTACYLEQ